MARSAEDCALLLSAMSGFDPRDSTSAERAAAGLHAAMLTRRAKAPRPAAGRPAHRPAEGVQDLLRRSTAFGAAPNTQACAVDLALPGALPVMNRGAVERAIRFGLAVGAKVAPRSIFARKNYFYPDLPKGYQISQYEIPVVQGGASDHLSWATRLRKDGAADARAPGRGRRQEPARGLPRHVGIDLNRAGTPLLEIVSEPDMRERRGGGLRARAACAGALARHLRRQHAGRQLPLRRQRVGAPPRRAAGHAARDQEPQQLPLPAAGDRLRGAVADRPDRGRRRSSRPPCCSTRTPARRAPCAARKTRTTTATSPTPTCRRW
jgi:hypothetical protein